MRFCNYFVERPIDMNEKELDKEIRRKTKERQLKAMDQENHRAQTITIGHTGGGMTEISMRGVLGGYLWNVYQPVEIVELINELAANIGCHIHIQPRNDFASWRQWREQTDEERLHYNGHPPFQDASGIYGRLGTGLPLHKAEKLRLENQAKEKENVATKKAVNKRTTKRSRTSTK